MRDEDHIIARVQNARTVEVQFLHEPIGMAFPMPPGAVFDIVAPRAAEGYVHVEVEDDHITAWMEIERESWVFEDGRPHSLQQYP